MSFAANWLATQRDARSGLLEDVIRRAVTLALSDSMPSPSDYKLDYGEAGAFSLKFRNAPGLVHSPVFRDIANAFALNMERVASLFMLSPYLVYYVARNTQVACAAAAAADLDIMEALDPANEENEDFRREANAIRRRLREAQAELDVPTRTIANEFGSAHINRLIRRHVEAVSYLTDDAEMRSVHVLGGVEAALFAMITTSYAAFETLCADLWVEALDEYPRLAMAWVKANNKDKTITMEQLSAFDFNLARSMGTFLSGRGAGAAKARFDSLKDLKANYEAAFGKDFAECWKPEGEIGLASAVRNVIAHRGGLIDDEFARRVRKIPEYADQLRGQRVLISGAMACRHVDACINSGMAVLKFVDDWAVKHAK